jgi:hypothetical protein
MGWLRMVEPALKRQVSLPVAASKPRMYPSMLPVMTAPPAVDSTPAIIGYGSLYFHLVSPVETSIAER